MTRQSHKSSRGAGRKNAISNVRIVDKDDGSDDIITQRLLQSYKVSEGQIRVVCNVRSIFDSTGTAAGGNISYANLQTSDDFVSFAAQYQEFRVRAIRFDIYDLQPNLPAPVNFWATYHSITAPPFGIEDVVDRPDSRSIAPGTGMTSLAWVAHGIPEMGFQPNTGGQDLGGLVLYLGSAGSPSSSRYQVISKFVVDFRGRR